MCCWVDITHLGVGLVFLDAEAGLRRCGGEAGGGGVAPDLAWVLFRSVFARGGGNDRTHPNRRNWRLDPPQTALAPPAPRGKGHEPHWSWNSGTGSIAAADWAE